MAWAIVTNGVDNYMALTSEVNIPSGEDFVIRFVGEMAPRYGAQLGKIGTFDNHVRLYSNKKPVWAKPDVYSANINFGGVGNTLQYLTLPILDAPYDYELKRVNGVVDLVDTATQTSLIVSTVVNNGAFSFNTLFRYANSSAYLEGNQQFIQVTSTSANHKWDASASDTSDTGTQPDLVDTISGNTARGRYFATDGSVWVDLGGEGAGVNNLQYGGINVVEVKYYDGASLVDVILQVNGTIVWQI